MMQSLLSDPSGRAAQPISADCFDLQIIRSLLQVKMTLAWRLSGSRAISLGFKQLAHGLHAAFARDEGERLHCLRQRPSSD
jgi:hypothetical protein